MKSVKMLSCGIPVVFDRIEHVSSAAIGIMTRTGAVNEEKNISGISHLIEHMLFKGTERRNARQLAEDAERLGAQSNAFTSRELTCYYMHSLSENADKAAEILLDMFVNSQMAPEELAREKMVVCEEMKMVEDNPEDAVHDLIGELIFKGQRLGNSVLGTANSVSGISRRRIFKYISEQYTRDSIAVAVSGNYDEERLCEAFEEALSGLAESKERPERLSGEYRPRYRSKTREVEQTHLCLGTRGFSYSDPRRDALRIVNTAFGGGMSSRLFQNIREEKGLAYSVYSSMGAASEAGDFVIYAGVGHDKLGEAVSAIAGEIERLGKEELSRDEFITAKQQIKSSLIFGQENVVNRMVRNARNYLMTGETETLESEIKKIDAISPDEVRSAMEAISRPELYSAAVISNRRVNIKKLLGVKTA